MFLWMAWEARGSGQDEKISCAVGNVEELLLVQLVCRASSFWKLAMMKSNALIDPEGGFKPHRLLIAPGGPIQRTFG